MERSGDCSNTHMFASMSVCEVGSSRNATNNGKMKWLKFATLIDFGHHIIVSNSQAILILDD